MSPALDYLASLGAELRTGRKFSLDAIRALLAELGNPQRNFASVHVAGTNGKGSVCALIEAGLRAAGHRTGLYTSPHLQRVNERIRMGAEDIGDAALARAAAHVQAASERLLAAGELPHPPAFFEVMTAIGFVAFADAGIRIAVVEVGLGGRLDATNVLEPVLAVITPIGMDHEQYLGTTLAAIAGEKAGILKPGVPALSAQQAPEAATVLGDRVRVVSEAGIAAAPATPLPGRHQRHNAALAALACAELDRLGFCCPPSAIAQGFLSVRWPGRLERIADDPPVILDGAHNPLAARALAQYWDDQHAAGESAPILIYGSMRDKAVEEICELLFPRAAAVVLTAPQQPRALTPEALARACGSLAARFEVAPDYATALRVAKQLSRAHGGAPIYVTGSLYLAGEARGA